jgi:hypothetical protein
LTSRWVELVLVSERRKRVGHLPDGLDFLHDGRVRKSVDDSRRKRHDVPRRILATAALEPRRREAQHRDGVWIERANDLDFPL